ncbi:MAG: glycosyltransferase family 4 protein [bacterium]|nr:glycosyltransferase family 4 protein [bacterium]
MNWIVSELFYPDEVSTAQILTDIALKKVIDGEVSVICGPSGYEKSYTIQHKKLDSRIKIYRVGLPNLNKNNLFERILRLILLTLKMSYVVFTKVKKNDNLLLATNPTFLVITVSLIKQIKKFDLEILVHDVFPENLIPAGLIKKDSFKYRVLSKIYNYSYGKADRLIVLGEDMRNLMLQKTAPKKIKIDIIPNWADDSIRPIENFNISDYFSLELKNKLVFGFAGNLGRVQGILEFIDLFKSAVNQEIVLVVIGDGALRFAIEEKIRNEDLKNIYFMGSKSRSEQNLFLNACNVGVITLKDGMKGLGVPSKTYNLMAAGKPIIYVGDYDSEIDRYIRKYNCGWSFTWQEENKILSFLNQISFDDLQVLNEKGINSRIAIEQYYKKEVVLNLF